MGPMRLLSRGRDLTVITSAQESADQEYSRRRRRYAIMMGLRALCVLGAALTYHVSGWLAAAFAIGGVILPWCAVIIANDGPPKKRAPRPPYHLPAERALPATPSDRVVNG
jgi:hypothetical protein